MVQATRRAFLSSALATAGALGVARAASSAAAPASRALPATHDPVLHAVRRLTFGPNPALVAHVRAVGVLPWLDDQLAMTTDIGAETAALGPTTPPLPYLAGSMADAQAGRQAIKDLQVATFARAAWGDAQVRELLVEFWSNHLFVAAGVLPELGAHKAVDDRDVVRAHALGSFSDMLVASAQSPAMLIYLGGAASRGSSPNENYARELLELHTVGVRAGYTQRDVRNAAKVLTGLGVDSNTGEFAFRKEWHATGSVRVLGWSHANSDPAKGLDVVVSMLRYLASHPATARHLATKLVRRLVADDPPASLVASAAKTYLAAGTAIAPVVRHIVASREFAHSADRKSQRPFDWCAAAVRALQLQARPNLAFDGTGVLSMLGQAGQLPFGWRLPDGYPDTAVAWSSTNAVLARWNLAQALVSGSVPGLKPLDVDKLVGTPVPTTAGGLVDRLVHQLLGIPVRPALRSALLRSCSLPATKHLDQAAVRSLTPGIAALVLSSPEAQVR